MIKPGERLDDLQYQGLKLIQHPKRFCFGTDAVLLASMATLKHRDKVADLGTGTGIIALLLAARQPDITVDAIEIQPEMADMASRSVQLNHLEQRIHVHCMDMKRAPAELGLHGYDVVVCNPPYGKEGSGAQATNRSKAWSRHELGCTLREVTESMYGLLRFGGRAALVYPAERVGELIATLHKARLEPKRMRTVHHTADRPPKLILVEAVREGRPGVHWGAPLVLYDAAGHYTPEMRAIYHMEEETGHE